MQAYPIYTTPPSYASIGRMIVSIKLSIPEGSVYNEEMSNFLGTQVALMQSGDGVEPAGPRLLTSNPRPGSRRSTLDVDLPKTTIFVLHAPPARSPHTPRPICRRAWTEYIQLKKEMRSQTSETTLASITEELGRLGARPARGEEELLSFQATNSVVFLQEQGNSAGSYLAKLNRQLADLQTESELLKCSRWNRTSNASRKGGRPRPKPATADAMRQLMRR